MNGTHVVRSEWTLTSGVTDTTIVANALLLVSNVERYTLLCCVVIVRASASDRSEA